MKYWHKYANKIRAVLELCSLLRCLLQTSLLVNFQPARCRLPHECVCDESAPQHLSLQIYRLMCAGAASRLCAIIYLWPVTEYDMQR